MTKKIYSLLIALLVFTACSSEKEGELGGVDGSEVAVSFNVDVPRVSVSSKASTPDASGEISSVEGIVLFTFDAGGDFLNVVKATPSDDNSYTAKILKTTRTIQFVANYDDWASIPTGGMTTKTLSTLSTDKYMFYGEHAFTGNPTFNVELIRNWGKVVIGDISQDVKANLSDIQYCVYNQSTMASLIYKEENRINLPSGNGTFTPGEDELRAVNNATVVFERDNQVSEPSFIILSGKYKGGERTYYKVNLSSMNSTGGASVYDIIRNYQYRINLIRVNRAGVSWGEVTDPNKIPDYNVITTLQLLKYPAITFGNESLKVTKTTYMFTATSGNKLAEGDLFATYAKDDVTNNSLLRVLLPTSVDDPAYKDFIAVVPDGKVYLDKTTGAITAGIANAKDGMTPIETAFYVAGGAPVNGYITMQRKIKLIVRSPYLFDKVRMENKPAGETGENKTPAAVNQDIWLKFTIPETVDESQFPLECRMAADNLYAVQDENEVRIVTSGDKDFQGTGDYYYAFKAYGPGDYSIKFKSNKAISAETVHLNADNFKEAAAPFTNGGEVIKPKTFKVTMYYYYKPYNNNYYITSASISYKVNGVTSSFTTDGYAQHTFEFAPGIVNDNTSIHFEWSSYAADKTVGELIKDGYCILEYNESLSDNINGKLTADHRAIQSGTVYYRIDGEAIKNLTTLSDGSYSLNLGTHKDDKETNISFYYVSSNGTQYGKKIKISEFKKDPNLNLEKGDGKATYKVSTKMSLYYSSYSYPINKDDVTWSIDDIPGCAGSFRTTDKNGKYDKKLEIPIVAGDDVKINLLYINYYYYQAKPSISDLSTRHQLLQVQY